VWSLLSTAEHGAGSECCPDSTFSFHCPFFLLGFDPFGLYCRICFCKSFIIHSMQTVYLILSEFICFILCWLFFQFVVLMYLFYTVFILFISLAHIVQASLPYGKIGRVLLYKISTVFFFFFASLNFKVIHKVWFGLVYLFIHSVTYVKLDTYHVFCHTFWSLLFKCLSLTWYLKWDTSHKYIFIRIILVVTENLCFLGWNILMIHIIRTM